MHNLEQTSKYCQVDVSNVSDLPEIGKIYNCFDDGKINKTRLYTVQISEIIPFDKIDDKTLKKWKEQVNKCYWLYADATDYFIKTINVEGEDEIFVRTKNIGWFSIGDFMYSGRLDIDGSLTQSLTIQLTCK